MFGESMGWSLSDVGQGEVMAGLGGWVNWMTDRWIVMGQEGGGIEGIERCGKRWEMNEERS